MNKLDLARSESEGISLMTGKDLIIYSVGISTFGNAELEMARLLENRKIIATTIDKEGIRETKKRFKQLKEPSLTKRINIKLEDVSCPLRYDDAYFDFIYARLVLHYLDRSALIGSLKELFRVLKGGGKLFVVVRSVKAWDANLPNVVYDKETCMTTYPFYDQNGRLTDKKVTRQFFTPKSIQKYSEDAGFKTLHTSEYEEQTYQDFFRKKASPHKEPLIAVYALKQ